jgi:hypothetical protein
MSNEVYANGREVSCKAAAGKSAAAFPDTCFTPPQTPATPPGVPIPYPNTGMASDATEGSKTVQISGQEVMLKDKSYFKQSSGDEAGSAPKKGVVSSKITGKVYFTMWSMDVKFEGENVVRHMDMTTHNHGSPPNTPPWLYADSAAAGTTDPCKKTGEDVEEKCTNTNYKNDQSGKCCEAKKCVLAPYGAQPDCCKDHTGDEKTKHHCVPDHCFKEPGESGGYYQGVDDLSYGKGLAVCVTGDDKNEKRKQHARIHKRFDKAEDKCRDNSGGKWTFAQAKKEAVEAVGDVTGCNKDCLNQQIDQFYKKKGVNDNTVLRADSGGNMPSPPDPATMGNIPNGTGAST